MKTVPTQTVLNQPSACKWEHCALALALVGAATLIRFPFQPAIGNTSPFLFYLPVVVAIALAFGLKPGLLAIAASIVPANYFWMFPERAFSLDLIEVSQMVVFSLAGGSVAWLSETARQRKELGEHLRATLASMGDAVITTDCRGKIIYLNSTAEMLTELHGAEAIGGMIGGVLDLSSEGDGQPLNAALQMAVRDDALEEFPERLTLISKTGRRHPVERTISRILDARGRKLGVAILFHRLAPSKAPMPKRILRESENPVKARSPLPRIAMISTHGYVAAQPPLGAADTGGQVVYVLELSKRLAQLGYEVDIWTRRFEDQPEIEVLSERVRIIRAECGGKAFIPKEYLCESLPQWNENALRFVTSHGLRYCFVNSHYWDGGLAGEQLSRALGVPHIHTPHSLGIWKKRQTEADYPGDATSMEKQYNFAGRIGQEKRLYATADIVVATTAQQFGVLLQDYQVPAEKCRVIPPGYDDRRFFPVGDATREAIRRKLGFTTPVVQAIGRLAHNKGYELLIQAFQLVVQRMPEARLRLAIGGATLTPGEETVLARLKALVGRLGLAEKVQFANYIPDGELADYYRATDVFVLSSRYEPFGMTAVEAMACGTPTVVTVHGGLYEAVTYGKDGLYADPLDPEDLGITILKVLKDPRLRARLSRMGAEKARGKFTWTGVAQQFVALTEQREIGSPALTDRQQDDAWSDAN